MHNISYHIVVILTAANLWWLAFRSRDLYPWYRDVVFVFSIGLALGGFFRLADLFN